VCLDKGREMIVTEYVAGKSLFELIWHVREHRRTVAAAAAGVLLAAGGGNPGKDNPGEDYTVSWPWTIQVRQRRGEAEKGCVLEHVASASVCCQEAACGVLQQQAPY
jgi:hypothetical protein